MKEDQLRYFTVESISLSNGLLHTNNILAISEKDALRFERFCFGEPHFRVLRAYPKINNQ